MNCVKLCAGCANGALDDVDWDGVDELVDRTVAPMQHQVGTWHARLQTNTQPAVHNPAQVLYNSHSRRACLHSIFVQ